MFVTQVTAWWTTVCCLLKQKNYILDYSRSTACKKGKMFLVVLFVVKILDKTHLENAHEFRSSPSWRKIHALRKIFSRSSLCWICLEDSILSSFKRSIRYFLYVCTVTKLSTSPKFQNDVLEKRKFCKDRMIFTMRCKITKMAKQTNLWNPSALDIYAFWEVTTYRFLIYVKCFKFLIQMSLSCITLTKNENGFTFRTF